MFKFELIFIDLLRFKRNIKGVWKQLKANGYTKTFLRNRQNQLQLVALLMKGN